MKKKQLILPLLLIFTLLLVVSPVGAQGPYTYLVGYQIQNLEGTDATVAISYYDQTDGNLEASGSVTVSANGSVTLFPFINDGISGPTSFNGSAVLSSDKQIVAIVNTVGTDSTGNNYGAATNGFAAGATTLSLPLIACNNNGLDTWFNVQNAGTSDANVTVTYIPGSSGASGQTDTFTIKPGAAKTLDQSTSSTTGTKTCNELQGSDGKFVGSATVESTNGQALVASVMYLGLGQIRSLQGYDGFTSGSSSVNLPLVMSNNSGFFTGIQVQNAGTNSTEVTVTFSSNTIGNTNTPNPETFTLGSGEAKTLIQTGGISQFSPSNDWSAFGQYVGGATITQTGSEPLAVIANQNSTNDPALGTAYSGFDPGAATITVNLPLVAANNSGYATGIQIQALQDGTDVTISYGSNTGSGSLTSPVDDTFSLNAGETKTLIQAGSPGPLSGNNDWGSGGQYVGSAQVTSNNPIIAIVNYVGPSGGDQFSTYNGFNQ